MTQRETTTALDITYLSRMIDGVSEYYKQMCESEALEINHRRILAMLYLYNNAPMRLSYLCQVFGYGSSESAYGAINIGRRLLKTNDEFRREYQNMADYNFSQQKTSISQ